ESRRHVDARRKSTLDGRRQRAVEEGFQRGLRGNRCGGTLERRASRAASTRCGEGISPGNRFEHHNRQRPKIEGRTGRRAVERLGRQIRWRASDWLAITPPLTRPPHRRVDEGRESKIEELWCASRGECDVRWL